MHAQEEEDLLAAAAQLLHAAASSSSNGTYLGLAYMRVEQEEDQVGQQEHQQQQQRPQSTNHFVLLHPNGSTVWDYLKAFPVPLVEWDVTPGGWVGARPMCIQGDGA